VEALDETVEEISRADILVLGPGSLFTSVMPNVLVPRVRQAILESRAVKLYVCNIVTQPGQTDSFAASDHYKALSRHIGVDAIDWVLVNSTLPDEKIMERYRKEGAELVAADAEIEKLRVKVAATDLMEDIAASRVVWEKQDLLRHHPDKLADAICRLYGKMELYKP